MGAGVVGACVVGGGADVVVGFVVVVDGAVVVGVVVVLDDGLDDGLGERAHVQQLGVAPGDQQRDGRAQAAGRYDAIRSESAAEVTQDAATKRVAKVIRRHAAAAGSEGIAKGALRKKVTSRDREHFDEALDRAVEVGDVEIAETWHGERVLFVGDPS